MKNGRKLFSIIMTSSLIPDNKEGAAVALLVKCCPADITVPDSSPA